MDKIYLDSDECCQAVRRKIGGTALLAFSRGKDAIATWLQLRRYFEDIRPIWFYLVPGLEFEDESIDYFERKFQTPIRKLPHPSVNRLLNNLVYQPPGNCAPSPAPAPNPQSPKRFPTADPRPPIPSLPWN